MDDTVNDKVYMSITVKVGAITMASYLPRKKSALDDKSFKCKSSVYWCIYRTTISYHAAYRVP